MANSVGAQGTARHKFVDQAIVEGGIELRGVPKAIEHFEVPGLGCSVDEQVSFVAVDAHQDDVFVGGCAQEAADQFVRDAVGEHLNDDGNCRMRAKKERSDKTKVNYGVI